MARSRRGKGEGAIYQLSDGRWRAALSMGFDPLSGKRIRKLFTGKTKREVQDRLQAALAVHPTSNTVVRLTVQAWLDHWLELIRPTVELATWDSYSKHVRILKPFLRGQITELKPTQIEQLYTQLLEAYSPAMVRKLGVSLSVAMNAAVRRGVITSNPTKGIRRPKSARKKIETLTAEETKAVLAVCGEYRLGVCIAVMLDTGFGPGEVLALDWPDFDGASLSCTKSQEDVAGKRKVKTPKNKHRVRRIPIMPETVARLHKHREAMIAEGLDVKDGPIFMNLHGERQANKYLRACTWLPILKKAGITRNITLYALRHTMATLLLQAGVHP